MSIAACGGSGSSPAPASNSSPGSTSPPAPGGPGTTASSDDSAARLAVALTALAKGYTFDTTVTVKGVVATRTTGRWTGGASEFVVTANGVSITYRALPPKAWVKKPDGSWVEVAGTRATGNPLDALAKPTSLAAIGSGLTGAVQVVATYPASALGLAGKETVTVTLTLTDDGSLTADFSTGAAATIATSKVILQPAPSQAPIGAPRA